MKKLFKGKVESSTGAPINSALIAVRNHKEFFTTGTTGDGQYILWVQHCEPDGKYQITCEVKDHLMQSRIINTDNNDEFTINFSMPKCEPRHNLATILCDEYDMEYLDADNAVTSLKDNKSLFLNPKSDPDNFINTFIQDQPLEFIKFVVMQLINPSNHIGEL